MVCLSWASPNFSLKIFKREKGTKCGVFFSFFFSLKKSERDGGVGAYVC